MMNIVELNESHYSVMAKHYVETFNAAPWNDTWTEPLAFEKISEMMDCRGAFGLVCFDDEQNFMGAILGSREIFHDCSRFFVRDFFVSASQQNKGIGSMLLDELEMRLRGMGIDLVYLFTSRGERTEGFYHKRDYSTWQNMILMGKEIKDQL